MVDLSEAVGGPADGAQPATGLYRLIDSLNTRLSLFERLRERAIGGITVGIPLLGALVAVLWFFGGDKIGKLFHG